MVLLSPDVTCGLLDTSPFHDVRSHSRQPFTIRLETTNKG